MIRLCKYDDFDNKTYDGYQKQLVYEKLFSFNVEQIAPDKREHKFRQILSTFLSIPNHKFILRLMSYNVSPKVLEPQTTLCKHLLSLSYLSV